MNLDFAILVVLIIYTQLVDRFEGKPEVSRRGAELVSAINNTAFLSLSGLASTTSNDALRFLRKSFTAAGIVIGLLILTPFIQNRPVLTSLLATVFLILLWVAVSGFEWQERKKQILTSTFYRTCQTLKIGSVTAIIIWALLVVFEAYLALSSAANVTDGNVPILTESTLEAIMVNNAIIIAKYTILGYGCVLLFFAATLVARFIPAWISLAFIKLMIIFSRSSIRIGNKRRVSICHCCTFAYTVYFAVDALMPKWGI